MCVCVYGCIWVLCGLFDVGLGVLIKWILVGVLIKIGAVVFEVLDFVDGVFTLKSNGI